MAARLKDVPEPSPFVLWTKTQTCVEKDLRGDTTYFRCVGTYSADVRVGPLPLMVADLRSTYPVQVSVVGEWRRSSSEAFASFCEAFAEVVRARTRQAMDPSKRLAWTQPTECIYCGGTFGRFVVRSSLFCDVCIECEGKP